MKWLWRLGLPAAAAVGILTSVAIVHHQSNPFAAVRVDPAVSRQTVLGWGVSSSSGPDTTRVVPADLRDQILDDAVRELGLNRVRLFVGTYSQPWEPVNDNANPFSIDWDKFDTSYRDAVINDFVLPFKQRLEPDVPLDLYMSDGFSRATGIPAWLVDDPNEYAEHIESALLYLKDRYGLEPRHYVIQNEPGNGNNHATPRFHADVIKATGPRLRARGITTKFQFMDGIDAQTTWNYVSSLRQDSALWPHVGLLSYHLYGEADPFRDRIRAFGQERGLPTAQTENMGASVLTLFDDVIVGGVSYWEAAFGLAWYDDEPSRAHLYSLDRARTRFVRHPSYWSFRQVMHYVRPGAIRIEGTSDQSGVRIAAFRQRDGITTVLHNAEINREVTVSGLPAGTYSVSRSVADEPPDELADIHAETDRGLVLEVPANSILTLSPTSRNDPPLMIDWKAVPSVLRVSERETRLSVLSRDPEGGPVTYQWSVISQPAHARTTLSSPGNASTTMSGITEPGRYVAQVDVSDGTHTARRRVLVEASVGSLPPVIVEIDNRNPSRIGLPIDRTELRSYTINPERDPLTSRWTVMSQPLGAVVKLDTPEQANTTASGLTKSGPYEFQLAVGDGQNVVSKVLRVDVYPKNFWPVR